MEPDIPADQIKRAQARVDELLDALRRDTQLLTSNAESALTFRPDHGQPE